MKRVVLVEDQVAIREIVAEILKADGSYEVVAECGDGASAVTACIEHKPDLVILDLMLPDFNGIEVLRRFSKHSKNTRVLAFSGYQDPALVREVIQAGAHGFVEKAAKFSELRKGIRTVADGGTYFGPAIASILREIVIKPNSP